MVIHVIDNPRVSCHHIEITETTILCYYYSLFNIHIPSITTITLCWANNASLLVNSIYCHIFFTYSVKL
jgi:hypothetical protein